MPPKRKKKNAKARINEASRSRKGQRRAERIEEATYIFNAKLAGYSLADCARMASAHFERTISYTTACDRFNKELRRRAEELLPPIVEEARKIEVARLDAQVLRITKLASPYVFDGKGEIRLDPDSRQPVANDPATMLRAEQMLVRVAARRAMLTGLDAPMRIDATVTTIDETDRELRELLAAAENAAPVITRPKEIDHALD